MEIFYLGAINLFLTLGLVVFRPVGEGIFQYVFRRFERFMGIWVGLGMAELFLTMGYYLWFVPRPGTHL